MRYKGIILLVDDDPAILHMVGDRLQLEGYTLVTASSGEEAFDKLGPTKPDLIILDIAMPGLGGLGFLRRLTSLYPPPTSPIMVFTGRQELSTFFTDSIVSAFLPKTTNPDVFIRKVHELVARHLAGGQTETISTHQQSYTRKKILLIEDDHEIKVHLFRLFSRNGMEVHHVAEWHAIPETATQLKPDVIFIKYLLPHKNGATLAEELGSHPPTKEIPVVLYDETGLHSKLTKPPFVRHLVHSIDDHALLRALSDIVGAPLASGPTN